MKIKFCPKCGSKNIKLVIGGKMGMYECKDCGFRGSVFPEAEKNKKPKKKEK
jgi:transposase-like protein